VRLDGRADLIRALGIRPEQTPNQWPDALLCLSAYAQWEQAFLDRLAGDFAFAIWDDRRQTLIVARDQLGVRLLYAANVDDRWLVSNSLERLAAVPGLRGEVDDCWTATTW